MENPRLNLHFGAKQSSLCHSPKLWISEASLCCSAVTQTREAALDAQLLVVATDLGKEKASQLVSDGNSFDPSAFAEHLVSDIVSNTITVSHKNLKLTI